MNKISLPVLTDMDRRVGICEFHEQCKLYYENDSIVRGLVTNATIDDFDMASAQLADCRTTARRDKECYRDFLKYSSGGNN